jgi:diadenosine tetraphosphatase ApaH/serine/threonine PP2A family protein phosphatase
MVASRSRPDPMRVAVISDIHANFHALEAVQEAIGREAVGEIWCLGDLVGYGPQPNECCDWAAAHAAVCLAGNHDLGVLGTLDIADFSGDAAAAAIWTRGVLQGSARDYLAALPSSGERDGVGLFHASPRDPVWEYVLSWDAAFAAIQDSGFEITLVGHSHVPLAIGDGDDSPGGHAPGGTELELVGGRWLLNPGSVGQPRDGDPAAAWLLLDLDDRRASFLREPYDVERTQAEIRDHGLPDALAERLAHGV